MKILFIVGTYKPAYVYGGPTVVIALLAEALVKLGHSVTVYTTTANGKTELDVEIGKAVDVNGVKVFYYHRITKDHTHVSPALWKKTWKTVKHYDVVHLHSWWNLLILGAALVCKWKGVKPLLTPHGMFCDYVVKGNNKLKKEVIHNFLGKSLLKNTFLHVSTNLEWKESQAILEGKWEGVIIPNLVELSKDNSVKNKVPGDPFVIGFISRVDPKKGIDILIKALSKVNFNYRLEIAGSGEDSYIEYLREVASDCGNKDKIEWVGWKDTVQKFEFYKSIDLFALTSLNENFAVVVIESLSVGTPVFLSNNVGLCEYVAEKNLGWVTSITQIDAITTMLNKIAASKYDLLRISKEAPDTIKKDYEVTSLTNQYVDYYVKMINKK